MTEKYYNPLECDSEKCGQWVKTFSINFFPAIARTMPKKYFCSSLGLYIASLSASNTYMSQKRDIAPVKISFTEYAEIFGISRQNIARSLKELEKSGWITKVSGGRGKASEYIFNFDRLKEECKKVYSSIKKKDSGEVETEVTTYRRTKEDNRIRRKHAAS